MSILKMRKLVVLLLFSTALQTVEAQSYKVTSALVTPNASVEAVQLYSYINSISGKKTLSGQPSVPLLVSGDITFTALLEVVHKLERPRRQNL